MLGGNRGQERENCRRQAGVGSGGVSPVPHPGHSLCPAPRLMQKIVLVLPRSLALTLRGSCHGAPSPRSLFSKVRPGEVARAWCVLPKAEHQSDCAQVHGSGGRCAWLHSLVSPVPPHIFFSAQQRSGGTY